jgi:hypothetical protein
MTSKLSICFIRRASLLGVFAAVGCSRPGADTAPASSVLTAPGAVVASGAPTPEPTPSATPGTTSATNHVYSQATRQITAKPGERFSVVLPASIGTPMKWRIDPAPDAAILGVLGESYTDSPPSDCADCTGYAGTRRFDFEAKVPGKLALDFGYRPLTQPKAPPEKQVHIDVSVSR